MSKSSETTPKSFGMAAQETEGPATVDAPVSTAAPALDAGSAASEAEPAVPALDAALNGLNEKLDRLISLVEAKDETPDSEKALDEMLEKLEGGKAAVISDEEEEPLSGEARDAALAILKNVRPALASIEDRAVRSRVTDALLNAVKGGDPLGAVTRAVHQNARKAADAASRSSYEQICADQKAAYDARNPHKKQEA